jgi:hypothetical protein
MALILIGIVTVAFFVLLRRRHNEIQAAIKKNGS